MLVSHILTVIILALFEMSEDGRGDIGNEIVSLTSASSGTIVPCGIPQRTPICK